jgi:STE24 endopeptidase
MSRFLPLVIFVIWMSSPPAPRGYLPATEGVVFFIGIYVALTLYLAVWSRQVARRMHLGGIQRRLRRFNQTVYIARMFIPAWFGVAVFFLGWKALLVRGLSHVPGLMAVDSPGLLLGTLPAFLAWMALWWAQYPAERALREQNLLIQLNENMPIHSPADFRTYFLVNLRLQLLFTIAPVLLLVILHDVLGTALPPIFHRVPFLRAHEDFIEACISLPSLLLLIAFSPEILRRVLDTEVMPDSILRRRLEAICRRHRIGFRDILLWKTRYQMGNAAVMGFIPRSRYILLSDLLLETMTDEQIEAVFAHEVGHVMHRHLFWTAAAIGALMFAFSGPGQLLMTAIDASDARTWWPESEWTVLWLGAGLGIFALVFGYVSRQFERQADVFAARTLQNEFDNAVTDEPLAARLARERLTDNPAGVVQTVLSHAAVVEEAGPVLSSEARSYVGPHGADVFCSALERVAAINNIPIAARSWCHGSISKRMRFLEILARGPARTAQFDKFMRWVYVAITTSLCVFAGWTMLLISQGK